MIISLSFCTWGPYTHGPHSQWLDIIHIFTVLRKVNTKSSQIRRESVTKTDAKSFDLFDDLTVWIYAFELAGNFIKRNRLHFSVYHADHVAVVLIQNKLCCCCTQSGCQYSVVCTWLSAALSMARNSDTYFLTGLFFDLIGNFIGNRRILAVL